MVIALAVACGLLLARLWTPAAPQPALEWLDTPRPVPAFTLRSNTGQVTANALRGHWHLLVLGYTHCPDLCPTTLSRLADLRTILADKRIGVILVSVDPQRDSPQQLAAYVEYFGRDFTGMTGSDTQLHHLAESLGMNFRRDGPTDKPAISHSPTIALIGPDGRLHARLRPDFDTQQAARELRARIWAAS